MTAAPIKPAMPPAPAPGLTRRLTLLIGQSVSFGLLLALLIAPAIALLISYYGSEMLAWVYVAVAVFGASAFYGMGELQRRFTFMHVATGTLALVIAFLLLVWAGLHWGGLRWPAFAAMVSFSIIINGGFVILGGQAGRLLDVRLIKRYFPWVISGFVLGFLAGGLLTAPLQALLGDTTHLFLGAAVAAAAMLLFLLATNRQFHDELRMAGARTPSAPPPPMRKLLAQRFIIIVLVYNMLSAMGSQLLDYLALSAAGLRYADQASLTQFVGNYNVAINAVNLVYLALFAGVLISRYGVRFGLMVNPAVDVILIIFMVLAGSIGGLTSTPFFFLAVGTRLIDIMFTDGTTRTSVNAVFQSLPPQERVGAQTVVEGIGVPVAIGLTGVTLLIVNAILGVTLIQIAVLAMIVCILWAGAGLVAGRGYSASLLKLMRRRATQESGLPLDDSQSLAVVERMLASDRVADVQIALDTLEAGGSPGIDGHLQRLLAATNPEIQALALARVETRRAAVARAQVVQLSLHAPSPAVQGAALRALCALDEAAAVDDTAAYLADPAPEVRRAAAVGLLRYGGIPGVLAAGTSLQAWQSSPDPATRREAARVIGEVGSPQFYQPLLLLLDDEDASVRHAAARAAGQVCSPRLLPQLAGLLASEETRAVAANALVAYGDGALPLVDAVLSGKWNPGAAVAERLVRLGGEIRSPQAVATLKPYLTRADGQLRTPLLNALCANGYHADGDDRAAVTAALHQEAEHSARLLGALRDVGDDPAVEPLRRGLHDALAETRARVFRLLGFVYDRGVVERAAWELGRAASSAQALATETLDVTLAGEHKALVMPLLDPKLNLAQRIQQLGKRFAVPTLSRDEQLRNLIANPDGSWGQPWLRACAIYAVGKLGLGSALPLVAAVAGDPDPVVQETAQWALQGSTASYLPKQ